MSDPKQGLSDFTTRARDGLAQLRAELARARLDVDRRTVAEPDNPASAAASAAIEAAEEIAARVAARVEDVERRGLPGWVGMALSVKTLSELGGALDNLRKRGER